MSAWKGEGCPDLVAPANSNTARLATGGTMSAIEFARMMEDPTAPLPGDSMAERANASAAI